MTETFKKAAIVIDTWKLPIFAKHLTQAEYYYETSGELVDQTLVLTVFTKDVMALAEVVKAATAEAFRKGKEDGK